MKKFTFQNFINVNLRQTLCYQLRPRKESNQDDAWIYTVVLPKQSCSISSVEDIWIDEEYIMLHLKEMSLSKNKEIYAWVHWRPVGPNGVNSL